LFPENNQSRSKTEFTISRPNNSKRRLITLSILETLIWEIKKLARILILDYAQKHRVLLKMDWLLNNVAVGSWKDAANRELLESEAIGAILNVRGDERETWAREANKKEAEYCAFAELKYLHLQLPDVTVATDDQFARGIAFIAANVRLNRRKVLVHCGEGMGRSPSFVAVYLLFSGECKEANGAINFIQKKRRGCFEGIDNIHIHRIIEFEKRLPAMRVQIDTMIESFSRNIGSG
jgi:protein-tyrosine phosphatase